MNESHLPNLSIVQLALNTCDLPGTLRLYSELFGFRNAGANALWGNITSIQGLPPDSRSVLWWMVGGEPFFQIEVFAHTRPACRPLPSDWRASDLGWVRFGVRLADIERVIAGLQRWGIEFSTPDQRSPTDTQRLVFRDPFTGTWVEVIAAPECSLPVLAYATSSVMDIAAAEKFYATLLGARIGPLEELHTPQHETLWGLTGSRRAGFTAWFGATCVEVVEYAAPKPRPKPAGACITDQGIMNIALGTRDAATMRELINKLKTEGYTLTSIFDQGASVGTYLVDPGREFELLAMPEEYGAPLGFAPAAPFIGEL